jgi:hypothetical protein
MFEFCQRDGSSWNKEEYVRPEEDTTVKIESREGNSSYGYYDLANNRNGKDMQDLYRMLLYSCESL